MNKHGGKKVKNRRDFCRMLSGVGLGLVLDPFSKPAGNTLPAPVKERDMKKKITCVKAKVISQKGHCALNHKVGDQVAFTEAGVTGKICIHALYSMMPGVFAMMYDADFPWLKDPDKKTHACPDAYNPVVFEISRIREDK